MALQADDENKQPNHCQICHVKVGTLTRWIRCDICGTICCRQCRDTNHPIKNAAEVSIKSALTSTLTSTLTTTGMINTRDWETAAQMAVTIASIDHGNEQRNNSHETSQTVEKNVGKVQHICRLCNVKINIQQRGIDEQNVFNFIRKYSADDDRARSELVDRLDDINKEKETQLYVSNTSKVGDSQDLLTDSSSTDQRQTSLPEAIVRRSVDHLENLARNVSEQLTEKRLGSGYLVVGAMFSNKDITSADKDIAPQDVPVWEHRFIGVTPEPTPLFVITSFLYPHDSAAILHRSEVRLSYVRPVHELLGFSSVPTRYGTGIELLFKPLPGTMKITSPERVQIVIVSDGSYGSSSDDVREAVEAELKNVLRALQQLYCEICTAQRQLLLKLQSEITIPVSWDEQCHKKLLMRLWTKCTGDVFPGTQSPLWGRIGFQGHNPITDFRGLGLLGLALLTDVADANPALMQRLTALQNERSYPLVCAGLHLSQLIVDRLKLSRDPSAPIMDTALFRLFCTSTSSSNPFSLILSALFVALDHRACDSSYMDFPVVMKDLSEHLDRTIATVPLDLRMLIRRLTDNLQLQSLATPHRFHRADSIFSANFIDRADVSDNSFDEHRSQQHAKPFISRVGLTAPPALTHMPVPNLSLSSFSEGSGMSNNSTYSFLSDIIKRFSTAS